MQQLLLLRLLLMDSRVLFFVDLLVLFLLRPHAILRLWPLFGLRPRILFLHSLVPFLATLFGCLTLGGSPPLFLLSAGLRAGFGPLRWRFAAPQAWCLFAGFVPLHWPLGGSPPLLRQTCVAKSLLIVRDLI